MDNGNEIYSKKDIEKYIVYPGSLKSVILNIYQNLTPGNMYIAITDQKGSQYGGIPEYLKSYFSICVNDGLLDETVRIFNIYEVIMEISASIYSPDIVQFELLNIFFLLYKGRYDVLAKKLNSDYDIFKQQAFSSIKSGSTK